ncbi:trigger factor [Raoultibacter massiliensis]|uniref:trigger factor n=1 Tax=Raoultibacter massiliensis TaxID=1852371 RepID=UPI003A8E7A15
MNFERLEKAAGAAGALEVEVSVSSDDVDELLGEFYEVLASCRNLDERLPWSEIEDRLSDSLPAKHLRELRRDFVIGRVTSDALRALDVTPALTPKIHALEYPEKGVPYSYSLAVVERPDLSLSSYEPVSIEMDETIVSDEDLEKRVADLLDQHARYIDDDPRPVRMGDHVKVDVMTKLGDETVVRLSGKGMILDVDGESMPAPFVEGMIGMDVGETRTIRYEVERPRSIAPDDVDRFVATVTVLSQQRKMAPDLTDEWVQGAFPRVSSVGEFLNELRRDMEFDALVLDKDTKAHLANIELEKRLQGDINDDFYQASYKAQMDKLERDLAARGKTLDDYFEEEKTNEQEFSMKMLIRSGESLRQGFALEALFDGRGMELVRGDLETAHAKLFGSESFDEEELRKSGRFHLVEGAAKRIKAISWLVETAEVSAVQAKG